MPVYAVNCKCPPPPTYSACVYGAPQSPVPVRVLATSHSLHGSQKKIMGDIPAVIHISVATGVPLESASTLWR